MVLNFMVNYSYEWIDKDMINEQFSDGNGEEGEGGKKGFDPTKNGCAILCTRRGTKAMKVG